MTSDGASFDGNNQEGVIGYQIEYSTSQFTGGDGTAMVYEFESFPHEMSGVLEGSTTSVSYTHLTLPTKLTV